MCRYVRARGPAFFTSRYWEGALRSADVILSPPVSPEEGAPEFARGDYHVEEIMEMRGKRRGATNWDGGRVPTPLESACLDFVCSIGPLLVPGGATGANCFVASGVSEPGEI